MYALSISGIVNKFTLLLLTDLSGFHYLQLRHPFPLLQQVMGNRNTGEYKAVK